MKKITQETFLSFKFVSDPAISADGKYTAFIVQNADLSSNGYIGAIHICNNQTGNIFKLTSLSSIKAFSWVDNHTIIFPAVRCPHVKKMLENGEEITTYYTIDVEGGEAQFAFDVALKAGKAKKLSQDKYLICATFDNNYPNLNGLSKAEKIEVLEQFKETNSLHTSFEELPFWSNNVGVVNRKRQRLYIYENKTITPITQPLFQVYDYKADDKYILYMGAEYTDAKPLNGGLYLYNIANNTTKCLLEPQTGGIKMAEIYRDSAIVSYTDGKNFGMGENGNICSIDFDTKEIKLLAEHSSHCFGSSVNSDAKLGGGLKCKITGDKLYYITTIEDYSYLKTYDLVSGEFNTLTTKGSVDNFDVVGNNVFMSAFKNNAIAELYKLEDGNEVVVSHFNDDIFATLDIVTPEYLSSDVTGVDIHGWVMKPAGYVCGNKYPAILHIHGGPRTVFSDIFHHEMQVWANRGYFVFYCNPRGGDGRGNEFADIRGKYGTIDYDDIMAFTDKVLAIYTDIDAQKLGVTGGSYGGFMTNWIIGHTNRFKAACAQRSISNWTSFEGTTDIGYYFGKDQTGASHTVDHDLQWQQSPLKYADKAVTPTLFIHSDQDYRCWMVEAFQMFTALKMMGVESRICLLKGENHELSRSGKPQSRIKRMEEINSWFDGHLK